MKTVINGSINQEYDVSNSEEAIKNSLSINEIYIDDNAMGSIVIEELIVQQTSFADIFKQNASGSESSIMLVEPIFIEESNLETNKDSSQHMKINGSSINKVDSQDPVYSFLIEESDADKNSFDIMITHEDTGNATVSNKDTNNENCFKKENISDKKVMRILITKNLFKKIIITKTNIN